MRLNPLTAVLLGLALAMAGCVGSDATDADDAPEMTTTDGETSGSDAQAASSASSDEPTSRTLSFERAVHENGTLPRTVSSGAAGPFVGVVAGSVDRWFEVDLNGTVTGANLTMTWDPAGPGMDSLMLAFGPREEDSDGTYATEKTKKVTGTSPLELSLEDLDWTKGTYVVYAWWDPEQTAVVSPEDQVFTIEGTVDHIVETSASGTGSTG